MIFNSFEETIDRSDSLKKFVFRCDDSLKLYVFTTPIDQSNHIPKTQNAFLMWATEPNKTHIFVVNRLYNNLRWLLLCNKKNHFRIDMKRNFSSAFNKHSSIFLIIVENIQWLGDGYIIEISNKFIRLNYKVFVKTQHRAKNLAQSSVTQLLCSLKSMV